MTSTYEGWTNRETWAVNLWLANDEPLYHQVRDMAAAVRRRMECGEALYTLEGRIREFVEELVLGDDPAGTLGEIRTDLLTGALAQVNWREIAEAWLNG